MSRPRIFIPDPIHPDGVTRLREAFEVDAPAAGQEAAARWRSFTEADAVIVRNAPIDAPLIDACPRLKVISKHGSGVDNIDIAAATERGVVVANVPGGNSDAVAEGTVALMLAALRRVPEAHRLLKAGDYAARWRLQYEQLWERTLGLVGIGAIGARVAKICAQGFRMRVLAYDPGLSEAQIRERGAQKVSKLEALLAESDVVSLHMPMTPVGFHLIGAAELRAMKPTAILVNTSRGPLIDERALAEALRAGVIGGAALDVFEVEPPEPDNPILEAPNVVLSPHTSGATVEAARSLAVSSAEIVLAAMDGRRPASLLNPEVWAKRRSWR